MGLLVRDVMNENIMFVDESTTVDKIAEFMNRQYASCVIVKKRDSAVGIITDTDIIKKVVAKNLQPKNVKAKEIMSYPLIFVKPDDEIQVATTKMRMYNISRVVVIDDNKNLVGIVTADAIARTVPELIDILELKNEIAAKKEKVLKETPEEESLFGICDECGNTSDDLRYVDGKWLCESCREELQ